MCLFACSCVCVSSSWYQYNIFELLKLVQIYLDLVDWLTNIKEQTGQLRCSELGPLACLLFCCIALYPPDDWYSWACFIQNASQGDDDAGYGRVLTNHCLIFSHYFTCCAVLIVLGNDFCFSSHPLLKMPSIFYTVSSLSGLFVAHSFSKHHSYALSPFETYPQGGIFLKLRICMDTIEALWIYDLTD